ncbi:MAG: hypothetical protein JNM63_17310, partial [Spirochaetia bacterium]|nr:hypothetical protein [Spirochaetia bacterium]
MKNRSIFGLTLQDTFFFLFLIGLSLGFYKVISPFLVSLFAAIVLSVSFYKLYLWLKARLTFRSKKLTELGRHVSSFSTVTVIALVIGLPLAVMTLLVSLEVADGYDN